MKYILTLALFLLFSHAAFSQIDSSFIARIKSFDTADVLKMDTVAVADDTFTRKIKLLRSELSGLTIEAIIKLKLTEEQGKDTTHSKVFYDQLQEELTTGRTGKLLENSLVNLYRRSYTEKEIDELIAFYKTSAGKKMDKEYFIVLVESAKDAEQLIKMAMNKLGKTK
jgi:hypothetical protein